MIYERISLFCLVKLGKYMVKTSYHSQFLLSFARNSLEYPNVYFFLKKKKPLAPKTAVLKSFEYPGFDGNVSLMDWISFG